MTIATRNGTGTEANAAHPAARLHRPEPNGGIPPAWAFLTNHAHVLVCLARDPHVRLRDVASAVGITERSVQKIVGDLERVGAITRTRSGRRNVYSIHDEHTLHHNMERDHTVGDLLRLYGVSRPIMHRLDQRVAV